MSKSTIPKDISDYLIELGFVLTDDNWFDAYCRTEKYSIFMPVQDFYTLKVEAVPNVFKFKEKLFSLFLVKDANELKTLFIKCYKINDALNIGLNSQPDSICSLLTPEAT